MSFPSDHAAVSMAFGIAAYIFASIIIDKKSNRWEKR
jgi:membrane-associated phospholipid phosphatase